MSDAGAESGTIFPMLSGFSLDAEEGEEVKRSGAVPAFDEEPITD